MDPVAIAALVPSNASNGALARRSTRQAIEQAEAKLAATLADWQAALPAEAETTWTVGAAYVRESSVASLHGEAPDVQLRSVLTQATQKRIYIPSDGLFFDVESGTDVVRRPAFQRLYERCLAGGYKAVVVYLHERMFRNVEQAKQYKRTFRQKGIELIYLGMYEGDQRNPVAWQLDTMQETASELHARNTSWYVGMHLEAQSREGKPVGQVPEAYRPVERAPSFMGRKGSVIRWELVEPLASIIAEGRRRYIAGESFIELARWSATTELGGVTPRRRHMTDDWWRTTLQNPAFAGHQMPTTYTGYKPGKQSPKRPRRTATSELVPSVLPALWTLEEHLEILKVAVSRWRSPKNRSTYRAYLLSSIAYDAECGHRMRVERTLKDGSQWMRCMQRTAEGAHSPARRADLAAGELDELLSHLSFEDEGLIEKVEYELDELAAREREELEQFRPDPKIGAVRQAIAALASAGIEEGQSELVAKLEGLQMADQVRRDMFSRPLVEFRTALTSLKNWAEVWGEADMRLKNELLREAGVRVVIGRLAGDRGKRPPARLISITAENPAFALALGVALSKMRHIRRNRPVSPDMARIASPVAEEYHDMSGRIFAADYSGGIVFVGPPRKRLGKSPLAARPNEAGGDWLTPLEFSARVNRSRTTIKMQLQKGRLPGKKVVESNGRERWLIHESEVERYGADPDAPDGPWLTSREFAARASRRQVYILQLAAQGQLRATVVPWRARKRWLIHESALSRFNQAAEAA